MVSLSVQVQRSDALCAEVSFSDPSPQVHAPPHCGAYLPMHPLSLCSINLHLTLSLFP